MPRIRSLALSRHLIVLSVMAVCARPAPSSAAGEAESLTVHLRRQVAAGNDGSFVTRYQASEWNPAKTAIVICDMWDDHYCRSAARRVAEMAPHMNRVINRAREMGVLIIHCPSGCMDEYEGTPQRQLARSAPAVEPRVPLKNWCYADPEHEPDMPVATSQPCDDEVPRERIRFYSRQIETLDIAPQDAVTDSAEAYYLMRQRGIQHVILLGVHTNMCVLGRPFGIRQLVYQGLDVVLMRDLTDSMYNPREEPFVSHFSGNDLVVRHIERHWCPTMTSVDFVGGAPFRFAEDRRPRVTLVLAEDEYDTGRTLPAFAEEHLREGCQLTIVRADPEDPHRLLGLESLDEADVMLLSMRRRTLPPEQLANIRRFLERGGSLVAIRTSSHAFCLRTEAPEDGRAEWRTFDRDILGGYYQNHHGNRLSTTVQATPQAAGHPVMEGVRQDAFPSRGSLYISRPLADDATCLMTGRAETIDQIEPVTWVRPSPYGGRVFYTSLGHAGDFETDDFNRLLQNAVYWAADSPPPARQAGACGCGNALP